MVSGTFESMSDEIRLASLARVAEPESDEGERAHGPNNQSCSTSPRLAAILKGIAGALASQSRHSSLLSEGKRKRRTGTPPRQRPSLFRSILLSFASFVAEGRQRRVHVHLRAGRNGKEREEEEEKESLDLRFLYIALAPSLPPSLSLSFCGGANVSPSSRRRFENLKGAVGLEGSASFQLRRLFTRLPNFFHPSMPLKIKVGFVGSHKCSPNLRILSFYLIFLLTSSSSLALPPAVNVP